MSSINRKRICWTLLFVVWLCVVWGHSLMPADASSLESSRFVFLVKPFFALIGNNDESLMTFAIRKLAHFSEYVILLALGVKFVGSWFSDTSVAGRVLIVIWIMVPSIDETIQHFVPGRGPRLLDVCIDMAGGAVGMATVAAFGKLRVAKKNRP